MNTKRPLSETDLQAHLAEQLQFLESSAEAFDRGFMAEAKRLATVIRVLLHDTTKSTSLLRQLDIKDLLFVDTALFLDENSVDPYGRLVAQEIVEDGEPRYVALLDSGFSNPPKPFDEWWAEPIFIFADEANATLSRKNLVLIAANEDGGTHVDPALDDRYASLSKDNAMGWSFDGPGGPEPMLRAEHVAIRQIAHEVLKTLKPGYSKAMVRREGGSWLMPGPTTSTPNAAASPDHSAIPKVGRNDPCPCGSGKKYKLCHGAIV